MFRIGGEVAYRGKTASGHHRIGDDVNVLVNFAGLKSAIEMNMPIAGREFAVDGMRKLPFCARESGRSRRIARIANRQHVARIIRRGHRVFAPSNVADNKMSQGNLGHGLRRHQIAAQQAGDGLAVIFRDGSIKPQGVGCRPRPTANRESRW